MKFSIAIARGVSLVLLFCATGLVFAQQPYPNRPIRYIIPYPPGGSTDPMGRFIAARLTERLGQQVIVDNRPGGNTVIGTDALARATPDGHTIGWMGAAFFSTPSLIPNLPYNTLRDFVGVATIGKARIVLVVHPSVPANNVQDVIALAKAKPGQLNFASSGVGTNTHLSGELFKLVTGANIVHIPYKGSGPATTDLLGGRVQMSFQVPITVIPMINTGKVRPIAVTGETRLAALSQVPTFAEAGLPGYGLTGVTGIAAPAKTPRDRIARINREVAAILATPSTEEFLAKQGAEPFISTPEQATAVLKEEMARYAKIIKDAGIKFEH
ncbi:MAG TPA: tripartite tricarboxylate transporter substrate binding protein [Burkholderiales bacterium]|nr:tripartite tricarboxylate transporter substrate binding protein [Burkholderiales bacterium]